MRQAPLSHHRTLANIVEKAVQPKTTKVVFLKTLGHGRVSPTQASDPVRFASRGPTSGLVQGRSGTGGRDHQGSNGQQAVKGKPRYTIVGSRCQTLDELRTALPSSRGARPSKLTVSPRRSPTRVGGGGASRPCPLERSPVGTRAVRRWTRSAGRDLSSLAVSHSRATGPAARAQNR